MDYDNDLEWHQWNVAAKERILLEPKYDPYDQVPNEAYYISPNTASQGTKMSSLANSEATVVSAKTEATEPMSIADIKKYDTMQWFTGMEGYSNVAINEPRFDRDFGREQQKFGKTTNNLNPRNQYEEEQRQQLKEVKVNNDEQLFCKGDEMSLTNK